MRQRKLASHIKLFYADSFLKDSWNTAKRLLQMRDELKEAGVLEGNVEELARKAEALDSRLPRIAEFFRLEAEHLHSSGYALGTADRLRLILQELSFLKELGASLAESLDEITLIAPESHWQAPWRKLFSLLRVCGVTVGDNDAEAASFQLQKFSCTAERISLTADRLSEAAEALAAVLKARHSDGTLGSIAFLRKEGSYELDGALERHGLCGTGCRECSTARPFIQLLPLYLRLQLLPFDPENLRQFLFLPVNPLPKSVRRRLLAALQRKEFSPAANDFACWPESWQKPFRDREGMLFANWEELVRWFCPLQLVSEETIRPDDMAKAAELLLAWAAKKGAQKKDDLNSEEESTHAYSPNIDLLKTATLCKRFIATADCLKKARVPSLDMLSFEKLLDSVLGEGEKGADGRKPMPWPVLNEAGQFWNDIDIIIWWDFADDGHALRESSVWSDEERHFLQEQACPLADIVIERLARSYAATAPFRLARRVVTVTPRFHDSEESLPHPLCDFLPRPSLEIEVSAILGGGGETKARVLPPFWQVEREELRPAEAPGLWQEEQGGPIPLPKKLNPSGLDSLLACPAAWYFKDVLRLDADRTKLSGDPIAKGNLAHEVMEELLKQHQAGTLPDDASLEGHILGLTERLAPGTAARYALAENEVVRRSMAEKLARSFKGFVRRWKNSDSRSSTANKPTRGNLAA